MAMEVVEQKGGETIACAPIALRILELRDVPVRAVVHRDDDRAERRATEARAVGAFGALANISQMSKKSVGPQHRRSRTSSRTDRPSLPGVLKEVGVDDCTATVPTIHRAERT